MLLRFYGLLLNNPLFYVVSCALTLHVNIFGTYAKPVSQRISLVKIAWLTSSIIAAYSASDVDIVTFVCDFEFDAIGDPLICKTYSVILF